MNIIDAQTAERCPVACEGNTICRRLVVIGRDYECPRLEGESLLYPLAPCPMRTRTPRLHPR
jgi:hypothetical protein